MRALVGRQPGELVVIEADGPVVADEAGQGVDERRLAGPIWADQPDELSQGQRKLVGVARAIAPGPRLLLLDEPAAGLDTGESEELGRRLRALAHAGSSMLLIDHDMGLVLGVCDRIVVLEFGKVIASGTPDEVRRDRRVVEAYLGSAGAELVDVSGDGR